MTRGTSWLDSLFAASLSCSWLGAWPPIEWMVDNRCDTAIPEPRQNEDGFKRSFESAIPDELGPEIAAMTCVIIEVHHDEHS